MQSILEERYTGNIGFDAGYSPRNSPFVKAAKRKLDSMEKLNAMLDDTGKELFDTHCDAQGDIEGITRYDTYTDALKFGILLIAEGFTSTYTVAEERGAAKE